MRRIVARSILSVTVCATAVVGCADAPLAPESISPHASRGGWKVVSHEDFENLAPVTPTWVRDTYPDDGRWSDAGTFFQQQGMYPPVAYRATGAFGTNGWLTVEAYSRSSATAFSSEFSVVRDPASHRNKVLRISSPVHTDAIVIRPTAALPSRYRVCLRAGIADFGSGNSAPANLNGYVGGERSLPWADYDAVQQNGFYWLTILDATPRPHNNWWIHHHRKVVIDSDNNKEYWTNIWNGSAFVADGQHPIMMFGVDKTGVEDDWIGKPFISYANGIWQPSGLIRAVDAYLDNTWYDVCIERNLSQYVLTMSGKFKFGGRTTYTGAISLDRVEQALTAPDYFMFGDPHNNWYTGKVYYDDIRLEVPR